MLIKEWSVQAKKLIFFNCKMCEEKFDALVNLLTIITSTTFKPARMKTAPINFLQCGVCNKKIQRKELTVWASGITYFLY